MTQPLWNVWHPEGGEDGPEDGMRVRAVDAEIAAENWASRYDSDDYPLREDEDRREVVKVSPVDGGLTVRTFAVRASISVNYYADEVTS